MQTSPVLKQVNESNLIIYFSDEIDVNLPTHIAFVVGQINNWQDGVITDLTPSYASLLISFNPTLITAAALIEKIGPIIQQAQNTNTQNKTRLIEIPVYYSPESGLDLEDTAKIVGVSIDKLIQLHSEPEYIVFALGFLPGYAFMGIIEPPLVLPRLSTPRAKVPAGSVAIAEKQTAVYPSVTPGGWHLLGRPPMKLFDPELNPPQPYQIGDKVKFKPIDKQDYLALGGEL